MLRRMSFHTPLRPSVLLAVCLLGVAVGPAGAVITGSAHDFSATGWAGGEICIPCHTPHNADPAPEAPLWNHEITIATYDLYTSSTLNETPVQPGPGGISRLCLSCHDGTVAVDAYGGDTGGTFIPGSASMGIDLRDDHPISIQWNHAVAPSTCANCHDGVSPNGIETPFFDGMVECATCHDAHNSVPANTKLLRMPLAGSQLCLHCHGK